MYRLTLTASERSAFDWVGDRYLTGDRFATLLCTCDATESDTDWEGPEDITFLVPEPVAWELRDLAEQEGGFPCYAEELTAKLWAFLDKLV